jgi:hypothetical protein
MGRSKDYRDNDSNSSRTRRENITRSKDYCDNDSNSSRTRRENITRSKDNRDNDSNSSRTRRENITRSKDNRDNDSNSSRARRENITRSKDNRDNDSNSSRTRPKNLNQSNSHITFPNSIPKTIQNAYKDKRGISPTIQRNKNKIKSKPSEDIADSNELVNESSDIDERLHKLEMYLQKTLV